MHNVTRDKYVAVLSVAISTLNACSFLRSCRG